MCTYKVALLCICHLAPNSWYLACSLKNLLFSCPLTCMNQDRILGFNPHVHTSGINPHKIVTLDKTSAHCSSSEHVAYTVGIDVDNGPKWSDEQ